jgi:hypothetical protein
MKSSFISFFVAAALAAVMRNALSVFVTGLLISAAHAQLPVSGRPVPGEDGTFSFAGGGGNGLGGGVCNIETLTMNDCSLIDNSATGGEGGNDSGGNNGMVI